MISIQYKHKKILSAIILLFVLTNIGAQNKGSYIDYQKYRLQKVPKFRSFEGNDSISHSFFQIYGGSSFALVPGITNGIKYPGAELGVSLGQWFTPIHGARLSLFGKYYNAYPLGELVRVKGVGVSLDYLMNLSALAKDFNAGRKFELLGIAGGEYLFPQFEKGYSGSYGFRAGLQARYALNYGSVFFIEPRIGIYSDNLDFTDSWRDYNIAGSLVAGIEFRTTPRNRRYTDRFHSSLFRDNVFLFSGLGIGGLIAPGCSDLDRYAGGNFFAGLGKWFSPYSGARLTGKATVFKYPVTKNKVKALGLQADYLLNLNNLFYGYDASRFFNLTAVTGFNYDYLRNGKDQNLFGVGAGLKASFKLSDEFCFFLEPRVNYYPGQYYATGLNGEYHSRANFMINAGFELNSNPQKFSSTKKKMENSSLADNTFIGIAYGFNSPMKQAAFYKNNVDPRAALYVGKWFTGISGLRLSADLGKLWKSNKQPGAKIATIGADYLFNITSLMNGYDLDRKFDLIGAVGANLAFRSSSLNHKTYLGGEVSLQGLWNVTPSFGLFLEPQLRLYSDNFAERSIHFAKMDGVLALMGGVNLRLKDFSTKQKSLFRNDNKSNSYFAFSAGTNFLATHIKRANAFGFSGQMALGKWINPVAGWRLGMNGEYRQENALKYLYGGAEADYMLSLSTMAFGYDPDRRLNLNAFVGLNAGVDYEHRSLDFVPGISAGGQVVFKASPTVDLFIEPKATLRSRFRNSGAKDVMNVQIGLNYKLSSEKIAYAQDFAKDDHSKYFVTASLGIGGYGGSFNNGDLKAKDLSGMYTLAIGKRISPVSYFRLGLNRKDLTNATSSDVVVTAFNADYMANLTTLAAGYDKDRKLEFLGVVGASINLASKKGFDLTIPLGLELGVQAKIGLSRKIDLTLEPALDLYNKSIDKSYNRRGRATGEFKVGINYNL